MLSTALLFLRSLSVGLGLALLVLFPAPSALWQMACEMVPGLPGEWPLLSVVFQSWDAGAQQPMARALLRSLCAMVALAGLFLPSLRLQAGWTRPGWMVFGTFFVALGALSAVLAPHRFQALREWETWALAGLVAYTVAAQWQERWSAWFLGLLYGLTGLTLLHAVSVGIPGSKERLGGIFHHPNALSTFCLMLLAVTFSRAFASGRDAKLAQVASGVLLGLAICAGSLTGGAILVGTAVALAPGHWRLVPRSLLGLLAAGSLVVTNLLGGEWSVLALPSLLVLAWIGAEFFRPEAKVLAATWGIAAVAGLVLLANTQLAPPQSLGQAGASRQASGAGRLEFYQTTLRMTAENPLLGVGPGGFSRSFPARQTTVSYFSKFPHSLPLEIASEWGLPAALTLALLLVGALRQAAGSVSPEARMGGWVVAVFLLHSLTDVQTQFPYLLVLAAMALGLIAVGDRVEHPPEVAPEGISTLITRALLAIGCLALLVLNLGRAGAGFDRTLATAIAQRARAAATRQVVNGLLFTSFDSDPLDSESARLWGISLLATQERQAAAGLAELAADLDPRRASVKLLQLTATPPLKENAVAQYRGAIELDRVNYPTFYRGLAEALWAEGAPEQALSVLREQAPVYARSSVAGLFDFRQDDLEEQLVEFYGLKAALEEQSEPGRGEPDLRLALQLCHGRRSRLSRLRDYLSALGGPSRAAFPGDKLSAKLQMLLDPFPAQQGPGSVEAPLDQPQDL